jgi:hypothetical protein
VTKAIKLLLQLSSSLLYNDFDESSLNIQIVNAAKLVYGGGGG